MTHENDHMKRFDNQIHFPHRLSDNRGFTLVEVLVVTVVIGILIVLAFPIFKKIQEKSRIQRTIVELGIIQTDIIAFNLDTGGFPTTLAQTNTIVTDDPYGNPYQYHLISTNPANAKNDGLVTDLNTDFDLYSFGKDGATAQEIDEAVCRDDIVRVNEGRWFGLGEDFL